MFGSFHTSKYHSAKFIALESDFVTFVADLPGAPTSEESWFPNTVWMHEGSARKIVVGKLPGENSTHHIDNQRAAVVRIRRCTIDCAQTKLQAPPPLKDQ
jgi:hypothetical protein